jgi:hypothetical protein
MHTVTVLQYWHIPLTAVLYVLSLGIPMVEKKKHTGKLHYCIWALCYLVSPLAQLGFLASRVSNHSGHRNRNYKL